MYLTSSDSKEDTKEVKDLDDMSSECLFGILELFFIISDECVDG